LGLLLLFFLSWVGGNREGKLMLMLMVVVLTAYEERLLLGKL
jgi:hypothetical protein